LISDLTTPTILTFYNLSAPTKISTDASSYELRAVLSDSMWHPVAYACCSMTDTEAHYVQIEKEALTLTWAQKVQLLYSWETHILPWKPIINHWSNTLLQTPRQLATTGFKV